MRALLEQRNAFCFEAQTSVSGLSKTNLMLYLYIFIYVYIKKQAWMYFVIYQYITRIPPISVCTSNRNRISSRTFKWVFNTVNQLLCTFN